MSHVLQLIALAVTCLGWFAAIDGRHNTAVPMIIGGVTAFAVLS